jgi:hypothetical protein
LVDEAEDEEGEVGRDHFYSGYGWETRFEGILKVGEDETGITESTSAL